MKKTVTVDLEQLYPVIKEQLASGGSFKFSPKGISMLPLIRQNVDSVCISPFDRRLQKYDVILYRRDNGQFVLHRIVKVTKTGYVLCGDNQTVREYGIKDENIIGIMTEIIKPNKTVKITDTDYIKYSKKRVLHQHLKGKVLKVRSVLGRIKRRLIAKGN